MTRRYYARSASDRTDDWPFWFVADAQRGGLNVTADLMRQHVNPEHAGATLETQAGAEWLAQKANGETP